jgi:ABC-2 type transport system permease protein/lipopolysaccharide transport system permease protein
MSAVEQIPTTAESARVATATEPRPELWFKRRVGLWSAMRELWAFRELIITLAERDLRVRYKQAILGLVWALITPVAMMLAFTLIFTKITTVNTGGAPYALFSYLGLLPWTFFNTTVTQGGGSLVSNVGLLNKLYCPREVFPISQMLDAAVDALLATLVLIVLFPITGFAPKIQTLYVPLLIVVLVIFTLGVTLAVAATVVFMRDLRLVLPLALQFGLFVTPVVYSASNIVHTREGEVIYSFINPLVPVLGGMRRCVLEGLPPDWLLLGVGSISSLIALIGGFLLFKRLETGIADVA